MTDRDELFYEKDREELTHRLEQEVASSIVSLWRQQMKDHHEHHEEDQLSEKSDVSNAPQRVKWSDNVLEKLNGEPVTKRSHRLPNPASKYRISG